MLRHTLLISIFLAASTLLLAACGAPRVAPTATPDPNMLLTAAVSTVHTELTRVAELTPTATITPSPTHTATPTEEVTLEPTQPVPTATQPEPTTAVSPDRAEFVSQSVADNSKFPPGTYFAVTWRMKNVGTSTWNTSYQLRHFSGDSLGAAPTIKFPKEVKPGEQVDLLVDMKAPMTGGAFQSTWVLTNDQGVNFFPVYIIIEVSGAAVTTGTVVPSEAPTEDPNLTPSP